MFEDQNELLNNYFSEEFDDLTPTSSGFSDTFDNFLQLGFDEDTETSSSIPSTPKSPTSPKTERNNYNVYPMPNLSQRNTNLHQQSFAPIYYYQHQQNNNNNTQQKNNNDLMPIGTNLPFWSAAPLPFIPEKFPPEIIPNDQSLTEKDQKRLHRQEAIKKWMSKRTRRDFNRKVAPQKSQVAHSKLRIGGKFAPSNTDEETLEMEKEILRLKKEVEEEEIIAQSLELKLNQTQIELSLLRSHGLVNGMLKSQVYYPTLEPHRYNQDISTKDPRQSTIDYTSVKSQLKKTGMDITNEK